MHKIINNATFGIFAALFTSCTSTKFDPCTDFYQYVNHDWIKNAVIPSDKGSYGSFTAIAIENEKKLEDLLRNNPGITHNEKLIRAYYDLAQDEERVGAQAIEYVKKKWIEMDRISSNKELIAYLFENEKTIGFNPLYGFDVSSDMKNSNMNIVQFGEVALSLPSKDYYDVTKADKATYRDQLVQVIDKLAMALGVTLDGKGILELETKIAPHLLSKIEARDYTKRYHIYSHQKLASTYPRLHFAQFFKTLNVAPKKVSIADEKYYQFLNKEIENIGYTQWVKLLKWRYLQRNMFMMPKNMREISFDLFGKALGGAKMEPTLAKRIQAQIGGNFQDPLSEMFAVKYFPKEQRKLMQSYVEKMREVFSKRIDTLDWMDQETKDKAKLKLSTFVFKIGHPDKYKDYSSLEVPSKDMALAAYVEKIHNFTLRKDYIEKIDQPVDKTEWHMGSYQVNAYYNPQYNEIVFPTAILMPPFFDFNASIGDHLGGIGAVIGHEFSHGFDDSGSKFDAYGNAQDWWTPGDVKDFEKLTKVLVEQYNAYEVQKGLHVKGELTLGENIADLAGLIVSLETLKALVPDPKEQQKEMKNFFTNYARIWRNKKTSELEKLHIEIDPHSPPSFRVQGTLRNVKEFDEVFGCPKKEYLQLW